MNYEVKVIPALAVEAIARNLVEHLGSGMPRILQAYPKSSFRFTENFIRMSFLASEKASGKMSGKTSGNAASTTQKTTQKTSDATQKSSGKIIEAIRANNEVTIPELADSIGITPRAIEKQIAKLREEGRLRRVGPAKGGHWEILDPDSSD